MKPEWLVLCLAPVWLGLIVAMIYLGSCATTVPSGVAKMEFLHAGKQVCVYALPSDQVLDDAVRLRVYPGACPEVITDEPILSSEPTSEPAP